MIRIKISKAPVAKTSAKGNAYKVQEGYAFTIGEDGQPEEYPRKVVLMHFASDPGYAPGEYVVAPQSIRVGLGDRLELGRLVLSPHQETAGANAAAAPGASRGR